MKTYRVTGAKYGPDISFLCGSLGLLVHCGL